VSQRRELPPRGTTHVLGVLNLTPDSFSDGGRFVRAADTGETLDVPALLAAARDLVARGAAVLDLGAMSTRPGSAPIPPAQEWARLAPVWGELRAAVDVPLSLDTSSAFVLRAALAAGGVDLLNDVSALADDPELAALVAREELPVVLMHRRGTPATMQAAPSYVDAPAEVLAELQARVDAALAAGIARQRILLDPGLGFGKRLQDNVALLAALRRFTATGLRCVVGASRKSFLGALTGRDVAAREHATTATTVLAALAEVDFVRVHDVAAAADALAVVCAVRAAGGVVPTS